MDINGFTHKETPLQLLEIIRESLPQYLSESRLSHTISVEKEACGIAERIFPVLQIDSKYISDISAAALLHDITKRNSLEEQHNYCRKYSIETDSISHNSCNLLHSKTAAFVAKEAFGINSIVFSAIFNHTTGKENMNVFDKIIFLADYIEPTRTHEVCKKAREAFYKELDSDENPINVLDRAVLCSLNDTILHLINTSKPIDIQTIKARNHLLTNMPARLERICKAE